MKDLNQFTSLYKMQKTLRFELIPMGDPDKLKNIIKTDTELAESYKEMKKTIDEFHKDFIDRSLEKLPECKDLQNLLAEFYELYISSSNKKDEAKFNVVKKELRKCVVSCFKAMDQFKILDKKELIQKELEKWIDQNHPDLYYDKNFRDFTTYFKGYNENRMNMYSDEEKATAVSYRLINENLPKFIDNMRIFEAVKQSCVSEYFDEIYKDVEPWMNFNSLIVDILLDIVSGGNNTPFEFLLLLMLF